MSHGTHSPHAGACLACVVRKGPDSLYGAICRKGDKAGDSSAFVQVSIKLNRQLPTQPLQTKGNRHQSRPGVNARHAGKRDSTASQLHPSPTRSRDLAHPQPSIGGQTSDTISLTVSKLSVRRILVCLAIKAKIRIAQLDHYWIKTLSNPS